ncbi:DUF1365 domain-containing protein [Alteromonadaceae bacterium M269]|nr:DUF1365 domain-containing protein [Alteromonadaceae bacterium M269]
MESSLYQGTVTHSRFTPVKHQFDYKITLFWLKLSELEELNQRLSFFSSHSFAWARFKESDYFDTKDGSVEQRALAKMRELSGKELSGDIFMLGQLRTLGLYFSPVNFYFLRPDGESHFSHMLAEVSNTPWNQKHCYLVDMNEQGNNDKVFHVSPFNPIDMQYQWTVKQPAQTFAMKLACIKNEKHFEAGLALTKQALTNKTLSSALFKVPSFTLKSLVGIYWQALKLFFKGAPVYTHPQQGNKSV